MDNNLKTIEENKYLKNENKKLNDLVEKLYKLIDVDSIIVSSLDKNEVLKSILDQTKSLMDCEKSSVLLIDPDTELLYFEVLSNDEDMEALKDIRLKKGEGIAGKVWESEKIHIINEADKDKRISKKADKKLAKITVSLIAAPLTVKGKTIGVMEAMNKKNDNPFNDFDKEIFKTLSQQAAIAIYNAQLYEMAIKDGMTKLYIHRYYYERLNEEFKRSNRYKRDLSLIMFDIDHFKNFNDTYGHQLGDEVLITAASIIKDNCRSCDIPARYGGEEFSLILPETNNQGALVMAERIRSIIEKTNIEYNNKTLNLTISAGISSLHENKPENIDHLIEMADKALYHSKENGRNKVTIFKEGMKEE